MNLANLAVNARSLVQIAAAVSPRVPTTGPTRSADVTAQWLTEHLGNSVGAVALSAEPRDGTTGTTDRRQLVVEWDRTGVDAGLPVDLFIKSSPLVAKNRVMVAALDMAVNEVKFYQQASAELEGIVPKAHYSYAGSGARFLIVLEDLVAQGARPYALADRCEIDHARGLIDAFARLHAQFWESPRLARDLSWAKTWSTRPGNQVLKLFYSRGRRGAMRLDRPEATPAVRALSAALDRNIDAYYREFEVGPMTLLHGDSHLGNTYAMPDGRSGLLDWQVVWQGPGLREVTYWMTGGLDPDVRRKYERELLERSTAMTIAWPGLQAEGNADAGWRRTCIAVEDLETAKLVDQLR